MELPTKRVGPKEGGGSGPADDKQLDEGMEITGPGVCGMVAGFAMVVTMTP